MDDHASNHWSEGLPQVIYYINTRTSHTTKKTPYELVFGQKPRSNFHYWKSLYDSSLVDVLVYDDLLIDKITINSAMTTEKYHTTTDVIHTTCSHTG